MATTDQFPAQPPNYVESVFIVISQNNGKLNFKDLFMMLVESGNTSRVQLYRAIAQLTREGRIKRIKGIGKNGIDYFYYDSRSAKVRQWQIRNTTNA